MTKTKTKAPAIFGLCITLMIVVVNAQQVDAQPTRAAQAQASSQDVTLVVQTQLKAFGYSIVVDGIAGPQTERVVRAWQHANGILVDGVIGPTVIASLSQAQTVTAQLPAVRMDPPALSSTPGPENPAQIIRDVWPDNLEDRAIRIATRESNLEPWVINRNRNATGLFQIMWFTHRSWLCPQLGICAQSQLQDAFTNATAAYALYQRAGGWSPWAT